MEIYQKADKGNIGVLFRKELRYSKDMGTCRTRVDKFRHILSV